VRNPGEAVPKAHHRIIRVPPGESVVLNSAERAPYLLLVEILNDDLDFDPSKRNNKQLLKRIITKEHERKGGSSNLVSFNGPASHNQGSLASEPVVLNSSNSAVGEDNTEESNPLLVLPATPTGPPNEVEEEVDLVEQLYGVDHSLRSRPIDLSDSIVLPPAPKNKELDMAAWSRPASMPPSPMLESDAQPRPLSHLASSARALGQSSENPPAQHDLHASTSASGRYLSLDEYSERMRTAAIMLAQLNANLVREPSTSLPGISTQANPPDASQATGALGWLPSSTWLGISAEPNTFQGPIHPSLPGAASGPLGGQAPTAVPTRMKLEHHEAAMIRERIMKEMLALEEERMQRMRDNEETARMTGVALSTKTIEDEGIIRREVNKADPSAFVFSEGWATKKACSLSLRCDASDSTNQSRIRHASPYGHFGACISRRRKYRTDLSLPQLIGIAYP
jgi:phosphatidylinositol 4-kinase B